MAMETLGGSLIPGRPAAVFAGGRTHVFAIANGGGMNHWSSPDGVTWIGPSPLPGPVNLEPSYPCAVADGNTVHVFAIHHGPLFGSGGDLVHWVSTNGGLTFAPPATDSTWPIPGGANGVAATVPGPNRVDAYAITPNGIMRYMRNGLGGRLGAAPVPPTGGLPRSVPAVVSRGSLTELFAIGADGMPLRWQSPDPASLLWTQFGMGRPPSVPTGAVARSGIVALISSVRFVDAFAVTAAGRVTNWTIDHSTGGVTVADLPAAPISIAEGLPIALMVNDHIEVFAIGAPPNPFTGGPLVRWRRDRGGWSQPVVIGADLGSGGLGAAAGAGRVDVFGLRGGLLHWPAGIAGAPRTPWTNWSGTQTTPAPLAHCTPVTAEEVPAIVKSAERVPGARVRAVGSSWSFPDIAATPSVVVETNQLAGVIEHVIDGTVLVDGAPHPRYLVHVGAGTIVEDVMTMLDQRSLAPFTMGGSSGQTIVGVISTSVHGSDWDRGPIPNAVRAIELVGPGGVVHWIEPNEWRITKEAELRARLGPAVQIHYDDDWFDSVLVSVGSMGVITSVVLEVTDQHTLEKSSTRTTWADLRPQLASGRALAEPDRYVMVALDPGEMGISTCYVVRHRVTTAPKAPLVGSVDPLAMWCQLDIRVALGVLQTAGLLEAVLLDPVITGVLLAFGIPPLPPGVTMPAAIGILALALKAAGPGAVGDFLGTILNNQPEALAAIVSSMTGTALSQPTQSDDAHKIMAPPNPGECAARGLALELAFDATTNRYLSFVDDAIALLDLRRSEGMVLGGWFSMRFVGPSRAVLSPQQSARTCMIEVVGLRRLSSTATLLDQLERLGKTHGAIQHWGMFSIPNLARTDVERAFPRLDTWRRVRQQITSGGTVRTFENAFSARVGLDAPPAGVPLVRQSGWRWCHRCLGMAFGGGPAGPCPAGGTHDLGYSGDYAFPHNAPAAPGQRNWRWCNKCTGMTFAAGGPGLCPAGGTHDTTGSGEYTVLRNGQSNWRWCSKCHGLAFGGATPPGPCPAGGTHEHGHSGDYWLAMTPAPARIAERIGRRGRGFDTTGIGTATLDPGTLATGTTLPTITVPDVPDVSTIENPGEVGWRWCSRCQGLTRAGGSCDGGGPHSHAGSGRYTVPANAPTAPGQPHWRRCRRCETLAYRPGTCFAGGAHDLTGSADYTLRMQAGQPGWRHCKNCNGLWFSGNGGLGVCASPARVHDLGSDDYIISSA